MTTFIDHGSVLYVGDEATPEVWTEITELSKLELPEFKAEYSTTAFINASRMTHKPGGVGDYGPMKFTIAYDPDGGSADLIVDALAQTIKHYKVTVGGSGDSWIGHMFISSFKPSAFDAEKPSDVMLDCEMQDTGDLAVSHT